MDRQKTTAKKRRRNQNAEIDELSKLLPVKTLPLSTPMFPEGGLEMTREASNGTKNQPVDKISVLRITSTFLKFQEFLKSGYFSELDDYGGREGGRGEGRGRWGGGGIDVGTSTSPPPPPQFFGPVQCNITVQFMVDMIAVAEH